MYRVKWLALRTEAFQPKSTPGAMRLYPQKEHWKRIYRLYDLHCPYYIIRSYCIYSDVVGLEEKFVKRKVSI